MPKTKYPIFKGLHRGQKGFTLIELLIVIAILGVIAAVVVPNLSKITSKGYVEAANGELDAVRTAVQMHYIDTDAWPTGISAVTVGGTGCPLEGYLDGVTKCTYTVSDTGAVTGVAGAGNFAGKVSWDTTGKCWTAV